MSGTDVPYEAAAQAAYRAHGAVLGPWSALSAENRALWVEVAQRTVKAFHKARKQQHRTSP